ncbi:adenosylmethionine decarboxylase [Xenorhabdus sp. Flor]|uniref:adenosylmethionine decarboxylase n=1 Tax=Xenorhabdus cabanillasii TaxID=351673 RepID=UPI0019BAA7F1|nr:adenosylmethionine decarboxylase [Xenorhabdus sp. Flor]MBD2816190.1 adenosylmethionine decarboxylase [Xenorhabdus sp. Flor]
MNILYTIKNNMNLSQPIEILEKLLVHLYLEESTSNKDLSLKTGLPIPIVSAFKKELIKTNYADKKGVFKLTPLGIQFVQDELNYKLVDTELYRSLFSKEKNRNFKDELVNLLSPIYAKRPRVNVLLDQAHATLDTSIRRVMLLLNNPIVFKQKILFLGDDDLTSLALMMAFKKLGNYCKDNIYVKDIDKELLEFIKEVSKENNFIINTEYVDLKHSDKYAKYFDVILTDPPYTFSGLKLFLSRAISFAKNDGSEILLSFGQKKPKENQEVQKLFSDQNLFIKNIYPQFNQYHGGSIIGNVSDLYILSVTQSSYSMISEDSSYSNKIYTGEINPRVKFYQCKSCNNQLTIGYGKSILTIEQLIEVGCNRCKGTKFQYRGQEKISLSTGTKQLGTHLVIEMKNCETDKLKSVSALETMMIDIADKCKFNIINCYFHQSKFRGVSGLVILAESYFTIHTWPEYNYAALDLLICSDFEHHETLMKQLQSQLNSQEYECKILQRSF